MCQWNTRCDDVISINRSINLIIDYFNNRLIDFNRLIVAALPPSASDSAGLSLTLFALPIYLLTYLMYGYIKNNEIPYSTYLNIIKMAA